MQKKYLISLGFITAVLVASLLAFKSPAKPIPEQQKITCCKKASEECNDAIKNEAAPATTLENLSHQFISAPFLFY